MSTVNPPPAAGQERPVLRLARTLVQRFYACVKATQMYDSAHGMVEEASGDLVDTIRALCRQEGRARLDRGHGMLALNGGVLQPDLAGTGSFRFTLDRMTACRIGGIVFEESVTPRDVVLLCDALNRSTCDLEDPFEAVSAHLRENGAAGLRVERSRDLPDDVGVRPTRRSVKQRSVECFFRSFRLARHMLAAGDPGRIDFKRAKRVVQDMVDAISEEKFILLSLANIKNYDQYTFNHSTNVAIYSIAFGLHLGLDRPTLAELGISGLFHDLGKTRVPRKILNKTTALETHEWEAMKAHSTLGAEILLESRRMNDALIRNILVAFEHHLNADLGGYPRLAGHRDLNLFSRIVAIADGYDALTTARVYRNMSYTPQEALSVMLEGRGSVYDAVLLKFFIHSIGIHPIGSVVELSSREKAIVYRGNPDHPDLPVVRVFSDPDGNRIPGRQEDLSRMLPGHEPLRIERPIDPGSCFESIEDYLGIL